LPTYEYRCIAGHQYEKRESFSAPARQKCKTCGKQADRMIFAPPVVFKGSGFYSVDSRGSSGTSDDAPAATSSPASTSTDGHGHSHGPGGHSHGAGGHSHDSSSSSGSSDSSDSLGSAAAS
jgi:putative FmdB family regulatory protein